MVEMKSWAVGACLLVAAVGARAQITDNPLPAPRRQARARRRGARRRPATGDAQPAARRSGRHADGLGARQLRARCARRPAVRERLARLPLHHRRRPHLAVRGRRARCSRTRGTRGSRAASSASISIRSSRATACGTACTSSAREGNPARPDFIPPGYDSDDVTFHNVITEWRANDPRASTFTGTRRELLRVAHVVQFSSHPMGAVEFNPTARPGSPDYGLLYTSGSDLGFSNGGGPNANNPTATQRLGLRDHGDLAHRPAQPARDERREGARRLHDSGRQQVSSRRRSENARRDLRVRLPQRASAGVGSHRRLAVRRRHRHESHRRGQHRPQRRQLRLDEARRLLGERHDPSRRRAESALRAAGRRAARPESRRVHLSRRDLRSQRGRGGHGRLHLSRPHRSAARQADLRRRQSRPVVRRRYRGSESGRRRRAGDRRADRGDPALRSRCVGSARSSRRSASSWRARWARRCRARTCTSAAAATAKFSSPHARTA